MTFFSLPEMCFIEAPLILWLIGFSAGILPYDLSACHLTVRSIDILEAFVVLISVAYPFRQKRSHKDGMNHGYQLMYITHTL